MASGSRVESWALMNFKCGFVKMMQGMELWEEAPDTYPDSRSGVEEEGDVGVFAIFRMVRGGKEALGRWYVKRECVFCHKGYGSKEAMERSTPNCGRAS